MTGDQIAHIIRAVAGLFWVLLAAFVVWLLRQPLTAAVSRLASFEAFGVKFGLSGSAALDAAIELAQKNPAWPVEVPAADRKVTVGGWCEGTFKRGDHRISLRIAGPSCRNYD